LAIEAMKVVRLVESKCARLRDHRLAESVPGEVLDDDWQTGWRQRRGLPRAMLCVGTDRVRPSGIACELLFEADQQLS
jgi:hypothetical protein